MEVYCALVSGYMMPRTIKVITMIEKPQLPRKLWMNFSSLNSGWEMNHSQP